MARKKKVVSKKEEKQTPSLYDKNKKYFWAGLSLIIGLVFLFSFSGKAGFIGNGFKDIFVFLIGNVVFIVPVILFLIGALLIKKDSPFGEERKYLFWVLLVLIIGLSGIFGLADLYRSMGSFDFGYAGKGGFIGYLISWPLIKGFGFWVTFSFYVIITSIAVLILIDPLIKKMKEDREDEEDEEEEKPEKKPKIVMPQLKLPKIEKPKIKKEEKKEEEFKPIERKTNANYQFPPLSLLQKKLTKPEGGDIKFNANTIKRTLYNFGIPVEMDEINIGPTVTQYTLKPAEGVKLSKITNLANNLALDLASPSIRIEAPIPGRSLVGIEIPNKKPVIVGLRELLEKKGFQQDENPLVFALGKDVTGTPVFADLADMPHLLVAGTTGSGKTICLNAVILSLLYRNTPEEMKLVLVDPKKVEFPIYDSISHLLCPVIADADQTIVALKWLVGEMERRFDLFKNTHTRDIVSYNAKWKDGMEKIPYVIVVIDELADLMMARGKEIESYIVRLAQKARATGIHLILATQRPSVEVITGLIKANISSRIGLKVASQVDSRTMIDAAGAEKLLGKGDLLFVSKDFSKPRRVQCPYISEKEVKNVVEWIKNHQEEKEEGYLEAEEEEGTLAGELKKTVEEPGTQMDSFFSKEDPLYNEAKNIVMSSKKASTSFLQRRLGVGYARAARLMDILEERGVVGPQEGSRPREVYMREEQE